MKTDLLSSLLAFYNEDPQDPFNLYALALEYQKRDTSRTAELFNRLLSDFPSYLPTYYHAAQFFVNCNWIDKAHDTYKKGMQIAVEQHNSKAYQELSRAYRAFQDDLIDD